MTRAGTRSRSKACPLFARVAALVLIAAATGGVAGCKPRSQPAAAAPPSGTAGAPTPPARTGEQIYQEICAVCHMPDGGGVPNFQPALRGNAIVAGDPARLEAVIRGGSAALADREPLYAAEMPPFGTLSDAEMKAIVAYVRERFAPPAASGPAP